MRIVLVNWAKAWDGATHGGGVNGYGQALALELLARGHEVAWICGGTTYAPAGGAASPGSPVSGGSALGGSASAGAASAGSDSPGPCSIRRLSDWMGLRVFEVINSPVLAPGLAQFADPRAEVSSPDLEAVLGELFRRLRPEVVHFQNIEGFSAGCVGVARAAGAAVVYTLHNWHTICPQVYLMQGHRVPCRSFDGGRRCEGCVESPDPAAERRARAARFMAAATGQPAPPVEAVDPASRPGPDPPVVVRRLARWLGAPKAAPPPPVAVPVLPGAPADSADPWAVPLPIAGTDDRGKTQYLLGERRARDWPSPLNPEWSPLENSTDPDPCPDPGATPYGARRAAMLAMLGSCDRVLAVSDFVRRKFESLGVPEGVIETMPIGSWIGHVADRHRELLFEPPPFDPPRPVRLCFMGYNHWYKGLPMLADALELLTPDHLRRIHLTVCALGGESIAWRFLRMEPRLGGLKLLHGYEYHDIPWICGGQDLGLVPSVWWDNAPQTVFEFFGCGVPVLAAAVGGIPDFVREGVDGLLFRGNDRFALARRLVEVARDPAITQRLRRGVRPPKAIADHAKELESVYARCVSCRSRGPGPADGPEPHDRPPARGVGARAGDPHAGG